MKSFVIGAALFCLAGTAFAQQHTLTTYASLHEPEYIDTYLPGPSVGDMYLRNGEISLSPAGPAAGEFYSVATIVYLDKTNMKSTRSYSIEVILSEGSIYATDFVQTKTAEPIDGDNEHKHDGAIIGGTGAYTGIRGYYSLELLPSGEDGKTAKTVYTYWLDR